MAVITESGLKVTPSPTASQPMRMNSRVKLDGPVEEIEGGLPSTLGR
jgi:hypothetical protein